MTIKMTRNRTLLKHCCVLTLVRVVIISIVFSELELELSSEFQRTFQLKNCMFIEKRCNKNRYLSRRLIGFENTQMNFPIILTRLLGHTRISFYGICLI